MKGESEASLQEQITPSAQKGPKKKPQGEQNTMLSSKAIKKYRVFFSGLFGQRA
jgi:hypothetical protein